MTTTVVDDRTDAQRESHTTLIIGTDRFLSDWGGAAGGKSYAAWACTWEHSKAVLAWVGGRWDMTRVRVVYDPPAVPYRPSRGCAHMRIYVVDQDHRALGGSTS